MIHSISINNYALIDKTEIELENGFSVITGETGAGKSILLGAIGLTLGQRAEASAIMDVTKKCVVEIEYNITNYDLRAWFEENELDYYDHVVVRREITADGKSRGFINDTPVNNKTLKEFGEFIIDIHSQHQSLLIGQPEYQINILDSFCCNGPLIEVYKEHYLVRRKKMAELRILQDQAAAATKEEDYLKFRFSQLESAHLKEGEQEELEQELALLSNAEAIKSGFMRLSYNLRDMDNSVVSILKNSKIGLNALENVIPEVKGYEERLNSSILDLNDLADEVERKAENMEYDPVRIETIQSRLNVIYDLVYKYKAGNVKELLEIKGKLEEQLKDIQSFTDKIEAAEETIGREEKIMEDLAVKIHNARMNAIPLLQGEMIGLLKDLGIRHAEFMVAISDMKEYMPTGKDEVKFLFAANKNQQPGEISKVASGGEISRVMLSLKYVLSKTHQMPIIVFDEIDTGLSGEVAHKMACMMQEMAARMQVISISHLPQIAAAGTSHFKVYKEDNQHNTISKIRKLACDERIREIAGMMSGSEITQAAMDTARNLLKI